MFGLRWLLRRLEICPNAYYNYRKHRKADYYAHKADVQTQIQKIYHAHNGVDGYRSMKVYLERKGYGTEHESEITLYETARKFLKKRSGGEKLPSMKSLKAEKEKLTALKDSQYAAYQNLRGYKKELRTVCANVDSILGKDHSRQNEPKREKAIF